MSDDRHLLSHLGIMTIGQVAAQLLNLAALIFIARQLGDHNFGLLQVNVAMLGYAMVIAEWGLFSLGTRTIARLDNSKERNGWKHISRHPKEYLLFYGLVCG